METKRVEFWNTPEGKVHYRVSGDEKEKEFTIEDREIIDVVIRSLEQFFPDALERLQSNNVQSKPNYSFYRYRIADDFIRCNFGQRDNLHYDIDNGMFSIEEVVCPRRGVCRDEGVICKPELRSILGREEFKVAFAYTKGFETEEIADRLGKSVKTVKNQLRVVRDKLGLNKTGQIRKVMNYMQINL